MGQKYGQKYVSKVAPASVCGAIPLFLAFACVVLHTESGLKSWRIRLDIAILPYSAASRGPFELDCPEMTQALFRVRLLPSVITRLPFGNWWACCPVVRLLCNSFFHSSGVSTSRCGLCLVHKNMTNLAQCRTEKIQDVLPAASQKLKWFLSKLTAVCALGNLL